MKLNTHWFDDTRTGQAVMCLILFALLNATLWGSDVLTEYLLTEMVPK